MKRAKKLNRITKDLLTSAAHFAESLAEEVIRRRRISREGTIQAVEKNCKRSTVRMIKRATGLVLEKRYES